MNPRHGSTSRAANWRHQLRCPQRISAGKSEIHDVRIIIGPSSRRFEGAVQRRQSFGGRSRGALGSVKRNKCPRRGSGKWVGATQRHDCAGSPRIAPSRAARNQAKLPLSPKRLACHGPRRRTPRSEERQQTLIKFCRQRTESARGPLLVERACERKNEDVQDANKALGTAKTDYQECIRRADTGFFAPTPEKQCRTVDEKIDAAERCADSRHGQVLSQSRERSLSLHESSALRHLQGVASATTLR